MEGGMFVRFVLLMLAVGGLTACQSFSEIPMSQTTWRIEGEGRGLFGKAGIDDQVMRRAASLALREGYPRFSILDASAGNRREFGGFSPVQAASTPTFGGGFNTSFSGGQPVAVGVRNTAIIVRLFRPGDAGYDDALDAASTLGRLSR